MKRLRISFICLALQAATILTAQADGIELKSAGDEKNGYWVEIQYDGRTVSTSRDGELALRFDNEDYSLSETFDHWRATEIDATKDRIVLSGRLALESLTTDVDVRVIYERINDHLVEKRIELHQTNIPLLYYRLTTALQAPEEPSSFWSFDDADFGGGIAHNTYPAAGYMIDGKWAVGLLTDAGHRNLWTRNIRRRPSENQIGFRAINEICDAALYRVATTQERKAGDYNVKLTLGEVSDFNHPAGLEHYDVPALASWKSYNGATLRTEEDGTYTIEGVAGGEGLAGFRLPYQLPDGYYTIRLRHRTAQKLTLRLWKGDSTSPYDVAGLHYQTDIPSSDTAWTEQCETVFIANTEGEQTCLLLGVSGLKKGERYAMQVKDLEVVRSLPQALPYHRLEPGQTETKRTFIFVNEAKPTLHDLRLSSQLRLAEGLGFEGSDPEKCIYACNQMLIWIVSRNNFRPLSVPSINYAPDMYNRDSFWSVLGGYDKALCEETFRMWAATQTAEGSICTIITPCMGSQEAKDNEATMEFLWLALFNHRNYGTPIDREKIEKAYSYIIRMHDPDGDGRCTARFVLGQNDVVDYPNGTQSLAVNQGMLAVTLRVARELGLPVDKKHIARAEAAYREFYDPERGYLIDNRDFPYVLSFNSLLPEFVSWWLFDRPILTSEAVCNTLDRFPVIDGCSPIIFHVDNIYFTQENKPFNTGMYWDNGIYYNGGSWIREELCAYVAGLKHGWKPAKKRIGERLEAEITRNPDQPFSHEYLPLDESIEGCWIPSTRVFAWNTFVLRALEVAGLRTPQQRPQN